MKRIKYFLILMLICISFNGYGQNLGCATEFDINDTIYLPHYGNNKILDDIYSIVFPEGVNKKTDASKSYIGYNDNSVFNIPIKMWIYRNDDGSHPAMSEEDAYELLNEVNQHFANNNTGIQFYLKCAIEYVNATNYNNLGTLAEGSELLNSRHEPRAINWHLIYDRDVWGVGANGYARLPSAANNFRFWVYYSYGNYNQDDVRATVHEIAHTLGVIHTGNGYNGDENNCDQESVSRVRTQGVGCHDQGAKKCEVNGDFLCDTEASPITEDYNYIPLNNDIDCNYDPPTPEETTNGYPYVPYNYTDNWGDPWNPPITNYMSKLLTWEMTCSNEFTPGQIAQMVATIAEHMSGPDYWYNRNDLFLANAVLNGETDEIYSSQFIQAAVPWAVPPFNLYVLFSGSQTSLQAQDAIEFSPGFEAQQGAILSATVGPIANCDLIYDEQTFASKSTNIHTSKKNIIGQQVEHIKELLREVAEKKKKWREANPDIYVPHNNPPDVSEFTVSPNPFTHTTTFTYTVTEENSPVSLRVYNVTGGRVATLVQEVKVSPGRYTAVLNGEGLPDGMYLYRLEIGAAVRTGKLLLQR